jgi:hypothetical protein
MISMLKHAQHCWPRVTQPLALSAARPSLHRDAPRGLPPAQHTARLPAMLDARAYQAAPQAGIDGGEAETDPRDVW